MFRKNNGDENLVIVVGGPGGSGSSTIAKMLSDYFHLERVYGGALMREAVKKKGYDSFEKFFNSSNRQQLLAFDMMIDSKLIDRAEEGNVIIESKIFAGIATTRNIPCTVKIWITASLNRRAIRSVEKARISDLFEKIKLYFSSLYNLKKRWKSDRERYHKLYGVEYDSPSLYNDIIIDSTNLDEKETFNLILKKLKDGGYIK